MNISFIIAATVWEALGQNREGPGPAFAEPGPSLTAGRCPYPLPLAALPRDGGAARLGDDLFRHVARHFLVVARLHAVAGPALREGAHRGGVAEHFRQRRQRLDHLRAHSSTDSASTGR